MKPALLLALPLIVLLGCEPGLRESPATGGAGGVVGEAVPIAQPPSPCAVCVLGPATFTRADGQKKPYVAEFPGDPAASYLIVIQDDGARETGAEVSLNGELVIPPSQLRGADASQAWRAISLQAQNRLTVLPSGKIGATVMIWIVEIAGTVGSGGGSVSGLAGAVDVTFPSGTVAGGPGLLLVDTGTTAKLQGPTIRGVGPVVHVELVGATILDTIAVSFKVADNDGDGLLDGEGTPIRQLVLWKSDDDGATWVEPEQAYDSVAGAIIARTTSLSVWTLGSHVFQTQCNSFDFAGFRWRWPAHSSDQNVGVAVADANTSLAQIDCTGATFRVDAVTGQLNLAIANVDGIWLGPQIALAADDATDADLGFGGYTVYLASPINNLPLSQVFGFFSFASHPVAMRDEIDIELAQWACKNNAHPDINYNVWPDVSSPDTSNKPHAVGILQTPAKSSHSYDWQQGGIVFNSSQGGTTLPQYPVPNGPFVVPQGPLRVLMNVWPQKQCPPPTGITFAPVVIDSVKVPLPVYGWQLTDVDPSRGIKLARVEVRDANQRPMDGVIVDFTPSPGSTVTSTSSPTVGGVVTTQWTLAPAPGNQTLTARIRGSSDTARGKAVMKAQQGGGGSALSLNGLSTYGETAASSAILASQLTVEAWVRLSRDVGATQVRVINRQNTGGGAEAWGLEIMGPGYGVGSTGNQVVFHAGACTGQNAQVNTGYNLQAGTWYHLAATHDGTTLRVYVNGSQVGQAAATGPLCQQPGIPVTIGKTGTFSQFYFPGEIDEARVWRIARGSLAIQSTMRNKLTGSEQGLVANWSFDEGQGSIAHDNSPNHLDAALFGAPAWVAEGW